MTVKLYLECVGMFLLGQALMLFLFKIPDLQKLYKRANEDFSWKKYWQGDWALIVGTQVLGAMVIIGLDQLVNWKPWILDWVKWWFAGVGALGAELVVSRLSNVKKYIMNVIDRKTNIADDKV